MEPFKKKTDQAAHSQQEVQMRRLECAAKFWIAQTRKLMMAFWISVTLAYSGILWHTLAYSGHLEDKRQAVMKCFCCQFHVGHATVKPNN